jgi:hypothetical protein
MKKLILILAMTSPLVDQWWMAIQTHAALRSIRTAVEAYGMDHNRFPAAKDINELKSLIEPTYIRTTPSTDGWGTPILYRASADGQSYVIASAGSDKKFDEATWATTGYFTSSKEDMVLTEKEATREWVLQRVCQ